MKPAALPSDPGTLHLIPVPLGAMDPEAVLPPPVLDHVRALEHFVAENAKSARAFLKRAAHPRPLPQIVIEELNEHTPASAIDALLTPLRGGRDVGLISEAGCPAVADPGAPLVARAHAEGIPVVPHVGPSSLLLALMASGLGGQHFAFHGYLPPRDDERRKAIQMLEAESGRLRRTQIFIETPYRNRAMFDTVIASCRPETRLCVATDLTLPGECVATRTVADWRRGEPPAIERRPTVFLLLA